MLLLLTSMKIISLMLIRTPQAILISAGVTTLFLVAVLFVWTCFLSISLHRLHDISQTQIIPIVRLDVHGLMQSAYKKFNA